MNLSKNIELSIVVPIYNEEQVIDELVKRLTNTARHITPDYEIILVNDSSRDNSLLKIKEHAQADPRVQYVSFSRNFGHQIAILAGMDHSTGDAIVTIDADLQDPPELIEDMYREYQKGFKVIYAKRSKRKGESLFKRATAKWFYRLMASLVSFDIPLDVGDYRMISRDVLVYLQRMKEYDKYIRGQIAWLGFKSSFVTFERDERKYGTTNYPFKKMLRLAFNGITAFSDAPLKLATKLGFVVCAISFLMILYGLYGYFFDAHTVPGWASTIITITFLGGVQLLSLGVIGEYISRIMNNVRDRPLYVVNQTSVDKDDTSHE
ncbi:MAG: glycosyltransferase family 2 protein [Chitinophagales bacterium]|nr:glycosyltransferase family 2 protein [Chitinophagales bacterium]